MSNTLLSGLYKFREVFSNIFITSRKVEFLVWAVLLGEHVHTHINSLFFRGSNTVSKYACWFPNVL